MMYIYSNVECVLFIAYMYVCIFIKWRKVNMLNFSVENKIRVLLLKRIGILCQLITS